MKAFIHFARLPFAAPAILCAAGLLLSPGQATAQTKSAKGKASAAKTSKEKATAKKPQAQGELPKYVAANIKFLNVLSRYADALNAAKDPATAGLAAVQIEVITKDVILAGEELAKLGKPSPELEARIAEDKEVAATAARVAENTQAAVEALAANESAKTVLAPSIENFQAALNRIQQFAEDPQSQSAPAGAPAPEATAAAAPDVPKK